MSIYLVKPRSTYLCHTAEKMFKKVRPAGEKWIYNDYSLPITFALNRSKDEENIFIQHFNG